jgi:hypothetical protein
MLPAAWKMGIKPVILFGLNVPASKADEGKSGPAAEAGSRKQPKIIDQNGKKDWFYRRALSPAK